MPVHRGWTGYSDPMPRSVIDTGDDHSVSTRWWHERQAHARALRDWAADPRGQAWVPGRNVDVQALTDLPELFIRDQAVVWVRVEAFLLDAKLDPLLDVVEPAEVQIKPTSTNVHRGAAGPGGDAL